MKKNLFSSIQINVLLLFVAIISFTINKVSAQNASQNPLIGTWQFDAQSSFAQRDQKVKDHFAKNPTMKARVESAYIGKKIKFSNGGSYYQILANGAESSGKWKVEGNTLVIVSPNGTEFKFLFKLLGSMLLISTIQNGTESIVMVPNQYFNRI
tara:strand:- start:15742 stop:16203 length:462 start_codon:yes stop_codon:yes gene_type:complete